MADTDVSTIEDAEGEESEYLSIQEAVRKLGVSSTAIRRGVREGTVHSMPHLWGRRVRRSDVARLAEIAHAQPPRPTPIGRPPRPVQRAVAAEEELEPLDYNALAVVGEIGPATLAQIYDALRPHVDITFPSLVYSMRRLAAHHLVLKRKGNKGDIYEVVVRQSG